MRRSNKFFISGIAIILLSSLILGVMTRLSIVDNSFLGKYISFSEGNNYKLSLREEDEYTKIYFENNINSIEELKDKSDLIVKVKATPKRMVYSQSIKTKVEVLEVYKSDIIKEKNEIYIYEPNYFISDQYISMSGYNIMEEDKEYIFFLKNLEVPKEYKYKKDEAITFMPVSTLYSKISVDKDDKLEVISKDDIDKEKIDYEQIKDFDILTTSENVIDKYKSFRQSLD